MTVVLPPAPDPSWAYFLDVDGTLLSFASAPGQVRVEQELVNEILALAAVAGGALALITGRTISDIDRLFGPGRFAVAGQHGLERRSSSGDVTRHAGHGGELDGVRRRLTDTIAKRPELILEDKTSSLALHYRKAPQLGGYVHRLARAELARLGPGFALRTGKRVVEIAPAGRDKGMAIAEFMQELPFRDRIPAFVGDDATDEFGFRMINRLGGHSIKVGRGVTEATSRLGDVAAVRQWIRQATAEARRAS